MTVFFLTLAVLAVGIAAMSLAVILRKNNSFSKFFLGHNTHMRERDTSCPKEEEKTLHNKDKHGYCSHCGKA